MSLRVYDLAHCRAGDKGNTSNISVIAYDEADYPFLREHVTAERVRAHFAGIVALATGIMWGAKSQVDFSLQIIALKALPVLILGGFTSIPGAIVGGVIIGVGEKLGEFYWGPLLGSGIESWLAYVIALVFLLFRPQGLFGEKIIERI